MTLYEIERVAYANNDQARLSILYQSEEEIADGRTLDEIEDMESDLTNETKRADDAETHLQRLQEWVESVVTALRGAVGPMSPKQSAALADIIETYADPDRSPSTAQEHAQADNLLYEAMDLVDD